MKDTACKSPTGKDWQCFKEGESYLGLAEYPQTQSVLVLPSGNKSNMVRSFWREFINFPQVWKYLWPQSQNFDLVKMLTHLSHEKVAVRGWAIKSGSVQCWVSEDHGRLEVFLLFFLNQKCSPPPSLGFVCVSPSLQWCFEGCGRLWRWGLTGKSRKTFTHTPVLASWLCFLVSCVHHHVNKLVASLGPCHYSNDLTPLEFSFYCRKEITHVSYLVVL